MSFIPCCLLILFSQSLCANTIAIDDSLIAHRKLEMQKLGAKWKKVKSSGDSTFVYENSLDETRILSFHEGTFPQGTETAFEKSKSGDIVGPFIDGNTISIYKNAGTKQLADSVQVSHILFAYVESRAASLEITRTKLQAKKSADSLCELIKSGKVLLEDVVEGITDDPGSLGGNKGNYGWITPESGFIQVYKDAAFNNPVGATVVIESEFGYHIVQVETKTKEWKCRMAWKILQVLDTCYLPEGYLSVLSDPSFPGGQVAFDKYFAAQKLKYDSLNQEKYHGLVAMFSVDVLEDGTVSGITIFFNPFPGTKAEEQLIAILMGMPKWIPARTCEGAIASGQVLSLVL